MRLPASDLTLAAPLLGVTIDGVGISLDADGAGTIAVGPTEQRLLAFNYEACSEDCGAEDWLDLHTLIWNEAAGRVSFGILPYDVPDAAIRIRHAVTLPGFGNEIGTQEYSVVVSEP